LLNVFATALFLFSSMGWVEGGKMGVRICPSLPVASNLFLTGILLSLKKLKKHFMPISGL